MTLWCRSHRTRQVIAIAWFTLSLTCTGSSASDRLDYAQLKSVVRIETPPSADGRPGVGCGFLVGGERSAQGGGCSSSRINTWLAIGTLRTESIQHPFQWIDVFFYRTVADASGRGYRATRVKLVDQAGHIDTSRVRLHPAPRVDVVAIDVTDKVKDTSEQITWDGIRRFVPPPFRSD